MSNIELLKKEAGCHAADLIESGMAVGLGTGSTLFFAIERIAERRKEEKLQFRAVSTSFSTTLLCRKYGIPTQDLGSVDHLDLAIDGADEIDPQKNLIKGRGAAHLIEKIVAQMADRFIVVADESKRVAQLGTLMPVPIEVHPLALSSTIQKLNSLGAQEVVVRQAGKSKDGPLISDSGNFILDARFGLIEDPIQLAAELDEIAGVLAHGIFVQLPTEVVLATSSGIELF